MQQSDDLGAGHHRHGDVGVGPRRLGDPAMHPGGVPLNVGHDHRLVAAHDLGFVQTGDQALGLLPADAVDLLGPIGVVDDVDGLGDPHPVDDPGEDRAVESQISGQLRAEDGQFRDGGGADSSRDRASPKQSRPFAARRTASSATVAGAAGRAPPRHAGFRQQVGQGRPGAPSTMARASASRGRQCGSAVSAIDRSPSRTARRRCSSGDPDGTSVDRSEAVPTSRHGTSAVAT